MRLLSIVAVAEACLWCKRLQQGCQVCALQLRQHLWRLLLLLLLHFCEQAVLSRRVWS